MSTSRTIGLVIAFSSLLSSGCFLFDEEGGSSPSVGSVASSPAPLLMTPPLSIQMEATGPLTTVALGEPNATGGEAPYTYTNDASAAGFPLGSNAVTWTVVDASGARRTATQSVDVADTTPPTLVGPSDMQVTSTGALTAVAVGTASASDLVDPNPAIGHDQPAAGFPVGTTVVTWTATDASTNVATAVQRVTVTSPSSGPLTLNAPANVAMEASGPTTQANLGVAMAAGGQPPITITNDAPGAGFAVGTTTVTWTATDSALATATATQTVTVDDTTAPSLTAPPNVTADQGSGLGATTVSLGAPIVTGSCRPVTRPAQRRPRRGLPRRRYHRRLDRE